MNRPIVNYKVQYGVMFEKEDIPSTPCHIYVFSIIANCIDYYGNCIILRPEGFARKYGLSLERLTDTVEDLIDAGALVFADWQEGWKLEYGEVAEGYLSYSRITIIEQII